jgi:hypothetical protein
MQLMFGTWAAYSWLAWLQYVLVCWMHSITLQYMLHKSGNPIQEPAKAHRGVIPQKRCKSGFALRLHADIVSVGSNCQLGVIREWRLPENHLTTKQLVAVQ